MRGFTPSTPSRAIGPAPRSGIYSSYLTNHFPLKQVKKAPLCNGSWPAGPEGLSSPLQETRRDPLANANCNIASWMRHWRPPPRAGGETPPTGCKASGENEKISGGKMHFPTAIFIVFIVPVVLFLFVPHASCGNNLVRYDCLSHSGSRANGPGAGYRGRTGPCPGWPCSHLTSFLQPKKACSFPKEAANPFSIVIQRKERRFYLPLIWRSCCSIIRLTI